jgi:hypothetical protein
MHNELRFTFANQPIIRQHPVSLAGVRPAERSC